MNRNSLLVVIGLLAVVAIGALYFYTQERKSGVDIKIDENGVTLDGNSG